MNEKSYVAWIVNGRMQVRTIDVRAIGHGSAYAQAAGQCNSDEGEFVRGVMLADAPPQAVA